MRAGLRALGVRSRTTIGVTLAFAVALGAGALFIVDRQRGSLTASIQTTAQLRADDLAAALEGGSLPASVTVPVDDEQLAQIIDRAGNVLRSSPNITGEARVVDFEAPASGFRSATVEDLPVGNTRFRVVGRRAAVNGMVLSVYVGASLEPVDTAVHDLEVGLLVGSSVLVVLVGLSSWIVVSRALRPVETMRREVEQIGESDLHRRVPEPTAHDEVGRLARTMNGMLGRIEESVRLQRQFVADASHELRSPLTAIRAQLEVDLAHSEQVDWRTTERELLEETLRMQRLVEDLLLLARADAPVTDAQQTEVDIDDIVLAEARRLRVRGKVRVDARAVGGAQVVGDPDALARVMRNLLDNAERHARSEVAVVVQETPDYVEVIVRDDGPGVPAELRARIFERFARADEARDREHGGTGLGLAIVREIVDAHGGTIELAEASRGATFVIRLPPKPFWRQLVAHTAGS